jgi:hypothetical protein
MNEKNSIYFENIHLYTLDKLFSDRLNEYIISATSKNGKDPFSFAAPELTGYITDETIKKISIFDSKINKIDFLERGTGLDKLFSIVPVPYKKNNTTNIIDKMSGIDIGSLGTLGRVVDGFFPRIYSNWQLCEYETEPFVLETVAPGWYLFLRGTISDFCKLTFAEQQDKLAYHAVFKALFDACLIDNHSSVISDANVAYCVGCIESMIVDNAVDIPIKKGFLRTKTLYSDGSRVGILGSSYGFDMDGFWTGDGIGDNISISICIKIQDLL